MAELMSHEEFTLEDPLEAVEAFARSADMDAQRIDDCELHVSMTGSWRTVSMWFGWRVESQMLQVAAPLEMKVPPRLEPEVLRLLALINERLWFGHFDMGDEESGLIYRNATILPLGQGLDDCQAEILLRAAMDAFERFYPAFNLVIWGGKSAKDALEAVVVDTVGNA